jgi:hypothetical protein
MSFLISEYFQNFLRIQRDLGITLVTVPECDYSTKRNPKTKTLTIQQ